MILRTHVESFAHQNFVEVKIFGKVAKLIRVKRTDVYGKIVSVYVVPQERMSRSIRDRNTQQ